MAFDDDIAQRGEVLVEAAKALATTKDRTARRVLTATCHYLLHWVTPEVPEKKPELVPFKKPDKAT
jgi:phosphoribosylpyrophosphate synthetase